MPASRERWADLQASELLTSNLGYFSLSCSLALLIRHAVWQGSVTGLLEEVAGLVRRVEGLDEKLRTAQPKHLSAQDCTVGRSRTTACEELLRQRTRAAGSGVILAMRCKLGHTLAVLRC